MIKRFILFVAVAATGATLFSCVGENISVNLHGEWAFALDPNDRGVEEKWFNERLDKRIQLPGSLQEQGYGNDVDTLTQWTGGVYDRSWYNSPKYAKYRKKGNVKIPFWLQPEKHYVGVAWYQRDIEIPASWERKSVVLELERPHWETTLYVNGKKAGSCNSLQTPHRYLIEERGKMSLAIRVDNRININVGINAHSVSDHTQTNWNGIAGNIRLLAKPALSIDEVRIFPDIANKKADITVAFAGKTGDGSATLALEVLDNGRSIAKKINNIATGAGTFKLEIELGDKMRTWSEYEPNVYSLKVELRSKEGTDTKTVAFGMREIKSVDSKIHLNGEPIFIRGTLECAIFPLTGYPAMDSAYWGKIFRRCKEFGLNHIRFHSWCPPEAAFEVADRAGFYLQVECGGWTEVGKGKTSDKWFYEESERIVREYGNHPSFCLLLYGNEPSGSKMKEYLSSFVSYWKSKDNRRLYNGGSGWPHIEGADFTVDPAPRIQNQGEPIGCILNTQKPSSDYDFRNIVNKKYMPAISHEIGQWCVYPNFGEIDKYTGVLKPKNFEIFRETLAEHNIGHLAERFLYASGRLQTLCYKADIEAALRTPNLAGFQLLDLHDFPGQGSAIVGVLDAFWDTKGYVDGKEYRSFCGRTVPLARLDKMVFTNSDTLRAAIEMSHFDMSAMKGTTIQWNIADNAGKILLSGETVKDIPIGNCFHVANIEYRLDKIHKPSKLSLTVGIRGTEISNKWDVWVYPKELNSDAAKPYYTTDCKDALERASAGENVLFSIKSRDMLKDERGGGIRVGFTPVFWNTAWFVNRPPHTLGILCDPTHPALSAFPNDGYSDYQWWDVLMNSAAMVMDEFPADFQPVIHIIDDWFMNRKLGLMFETRVGKGKMLVCSADIESDLDNRHAARQLRYSIEQYMSSDKFMPAKEIATNLISDLLR